MATRIELRKEQVQECLNLKIASLKRAQNTSKNPRLLEIYAEDLKTYNMAHATLSEIK